MNTHNNTDFAKSFDAYARTQVNNIHACAACALLNGSASCAQEEVNATLSCASLRECADVCMDHLWADWKYAPLLAGMYYVQLQRWFAVFPKDQFLFVHYPDFVSNSSRVLLGILFIYKKKQESRNVKKRGRIFLKKEGEMANFNQFTVKTKRIQFMDF
jgi:hypothetical protein